MDRFDAFIMGDLTAIDACDKQAQIMEEYYMELYNRKKGSDYKRLKDAVDGIRAFRFHLDEIRLIIIDYKRMIFEGDVKNG